MKFDSDCGWPSFEIKKLQGAKSSKKKDYSFGWFVQK